MNTKLPRLLVLDDDVDWLMQVPLIFDGECEVEGFATIDKGMHAVQFGTYDIILLDLNFDGDRRDGLDLFRRIHAVDKGADVIVISAETDKDRLVSIFNAGVSQFVAKPASPDQIREAVRTTLRTREIRFNAINLATSTDNKSEPTLCGSSLVMQRLEAVRAFSCERETSKLSKVGITHHTFHHPFRQTLAAILFVHIVS